VRKSLRIKRKRLRALLEGRGEQGLNTIAEGTLAVRQAMRDSDRPLTVDRHQDDAQTISSGFVSWPSFA
jgi:hypothetical protein